MPAPRGFVKSDHPMPPSRVQNVKETSMNAYINDSFQSETVEGMSSDDYYQRSTGTGTKKPGTFPGTFPRESGGNREPKFFKKSGTGGNREPKFSKNVFRHYSVK